MRIEALVLALILLFVGTEVKSMGTPTWSTLEMIPDLKASQRRSLQTLYGNWKKRTRTLLQEHKKIGQRIERLDRDVLNLEKRHDFHRLVGSGGESAAITEGRRDLEDVVREQNREDLPDLRFDVLWRERFGLLAIERRLSDCLAARANDFWRQAKLILDRKQILSLETRPDQY